MAHRIVDETSLKTVADAIREKAGTSDSLVFPTGFAEAIAGIQAGGGSGGGGIATGTMTFAEKQSTAPNPGIFVTHNLGYTPSNVLWFIVASESISGEDFIGNSKVAFEYISPTSFCRAFGGSSNTDYSMRYRFCTNASQVFESLSANEVSVALLRANAWRPSGTIPAGSTVMWIVW